MPGLRSSSGTTETEGHVGRTRGSPPEMGSGSRSSDGAGSSSYSGSTSIGSPEISPTPTSSDSPIDMQSSSPVMQPPSGFSGLGRGRGRGYFGCHSSSGSSSDSPTTGIISGPLRPVESVLQDVATDLKGSERFDEDDFVSRLRRENAGPVTGLFNLFFLCSALMIDDELSLFGFNFCN